MATHTKAVLAATAALMLVSCTITREAQPLPRTVTVTEEGTVTLQNDEAVIEVELQARAASPSASETENAERMETLLSALAEAGVPPEKISTVLRTISQEVPQNAGRSPQAQYLVTNRVAIVSSDTTKTGSIIDAALGAGISRLLSVTFRSSGTDQATKQARLLAVKKAEETANTIATASGFTLGKATEIAEKSVQSPGSSPAQHAQTAATGLSAGTTSVTVVVQATYEMQ